MESDKSQPTGCHSQHPQGAEQMSKMTLNFSPLTGRVFLGRVNPKTGVSIGEQRDVTSEFLQIMEMKFPVNTTQLISVNGENKYRVIVVDLDKSVVIDGKVVQEGSNPGTSQPTEQRETIASAPVAAQHRFRHPQKSTRDWSVWQPAPIDLDRPSWEIDSQGFEVEYRLLYDAPQPAEQKVEPVAWIPVSKRLPEPDEIIRFYPPINEGTAYSVDWGWFEG